MTGRITTSTVPSSRVSNSSTPIYNIAATIAPILTRITRTSSIATSSSAISCEPSSAMSESISAYRATTWIYIVSLIGIICSLSVRA